MFQEAFLQHILEAGSKGFHVRTHENGRNSICPGPRFGLENPLCSCEVRVIFLKIIKVVLCAKEKCQTVEKYVVEIILQVPNLMLKKGTES